jgi:HEAT repeat protein
MKPFTILCLSVLLLGLAGLAAAEDKAVSPKRGAPQDQKLIAGLLETLKDPDEQTRTYAAAALVGLDRAVVPALIDVLREKDDVLRARVALILGNMGSMGRRHREAIPALIEALQAKDKEVRKWAAYALSHIVLQTEQETKRVAKQHDQLIATLIKTLEDPDEQVRIYARAALVGLDRDAVAALIDLLKNANADLRAQAATLLGQMGTMGRRHQEAVPVLTEALKDKDQAVRKSAAYALSQIIVPTKP